MNTKKLYFDVPTQVAFWDVDGDHYVGGIAYGSEVICGCCGGVVEIAEIYEFTPENVTPIVTYDDWEDFNDFIIGCDERHFKLEDENEGN